MKPKAIVLGAGMVGATMARDLARDGEFSVTVADVSEPNLKKLAGQPNITTLRADLGDPATLTSTVGPFDIVLGALPSRIGFRSLRTLIDAGKNYSDISFMPEDALEHDPAAKQRGVTAVVDCGVAPGLSNLIVGYAAAQLDEPLRAAIYVGGLPKLRRWPYQYKAPFAPSDVIEEYTRPARMMENGRIVEKIALTEPELLTFEKLDTLEAFNTDGLRSLLKTMPIPNMTEKTIRYPGHVELMRALRETGFFDTGEIDIRGQKVRPLDMTSKLLFPKWTYEPGEEEFTIMRVSVEGRKGNQSVRHVYELYDEFDRTRNESSMSRTTAFPATIMARMIVEGRIRQKGVIPPELLAREPGLFDQVLSALRSRGVNVTHKVEPIT